MPTFKKEYPTLVEDIMTECDIYSVSGRKFHTERAIWDTGADTTIISSRIVKELNLQPYKAGGISGIGGATGSNVYLVHMLVPTGDFVTQVEVMENDFQDIDVLIGMDIIVFGDFLITNADGKTTFQFRTPSEGGVEL
ncbi:MAG: retroviral-like aspartic protease family protein [Prevotella sp.]|nr:retroviral-like aspartic protease family protein [Prevotella sp.]